MSTDRLIANASADQLNPAHQRPALLVGMDQPPPGSSDVSVASIVEKASNSAAFGRSLSIITVTRHSIEDGVDQGAEPVEPGLEAPAPAGGGAPGRGGLVPAGEGGTPANRARVFQRGPAVAENSAAPAEKNPGASRGERLARLLAAGLGRGVRAGGRRGDPT